MKKIKEYLNGITLAGWLSLILFVIYEAFYIAFISIEGGAGRKLFGAVVMTYGCLLAGLTLGAGIRAFFAELTWMRYERKFTEWKGEHF